MNISTRELLQLLDSVECDMRGLEGRLTSIRRRLYEGSGLKLTNIDMDGHPKRKPQIEPTEEVVR